MIPRVTTLPSLVIGPPAPGAAWELLCASAAVDLNPQHSLRLAEIMASLAHWAASGEPPIMAMLPLADHADAPVLLIRAAGGSAIGSAALPQANAVIVGPEYRAALGGRIERLLPVLPAPDGSRNFGRAALAVPPVLPPLPLRAGWADIGLAWRNRILCVAESADVLPALATVLATTGPPEQAQRITGWATTALLPAAGDFDPWEQCQLLVLGPGRRQPHGMPYVVARPNALGEPEPVIPPPAAWRAWAGFRDALGGAAILPWHPDMVGEPVPALLARLADHADAQRSNRAVLVRDLLASQGRQATDLKAAGLNLLAGWLEQDGAADLPDDDWRQLGRPVLLSAIASLDAPETALAQMVPARVAWLAPAVPEHIAAAGPVGSAVALWLARHAPEHPALPAIIAARLDGPEAIDLVRLASAGVVRALGPGHAGLALRLTAAGLRQPAGSLAAIAASLAALRMADA